MKSGDPTPLADLQIILAEKRNMPSQTSEVVSEASKWLKAALKGAEIDFHYAACDDKEHYGYSVFVINREHSDGRYILEAKIAEIQGKAYLSAEVRIVGRDPSNLFPYFADFSADDGRQRALHYIADFLLSSEAPTR